MAIEYGLKSFKWKASGGSTFESLGKVLAGTPKFSSEAPQLNPFYAAQNPEFPAISIKENNGLTKVELTLMEFDVDQLIKLFGGTKTGTAPDETYHAPRQAADIHGSAELITESGMILTITKAQLVANFNWDISRSAVSQIQVVITVELPDLEADLPYSIAWEA